MTPDPTETQAPASAPTEPAPETTPAPAPAAIAPPKPQPRLPVVSGRTRNERRAVERRRVGVWEMVCMGQPYEEIGKHFRVSVRTVERDVTWWKARLGFQTCALKDIKTAAMDVGTTARRLEDVASDAYADYMAASNGAIKVRFLQTVIQALHTRHKILADAGFLPKIGHEKETAPKLEITFESRFGRDAVESVLDDPKSRRRVLEAAYAVYKTGMDSEAGTLGLPLVAQTAMTEVPEADEDDIDATATPVPNPESD